jgi:pyruvate carboxylase
MEGAVIGTKASGVPKQEDIKLRDHAIQCRITTEDPEENFIPDDGRITAYREATGFGVRLDGGTAYAGAIITRFYDPLLEKVTVWAPSPEEAIARMHRSLREFRIRGVATNLAFLENIITHPDFVNNRYTTRFIDTTPALAGLAEEITGVGDDLLAILESAAADGRQRPDRELDRRQVKLAEFRRHDWSTAGRPLPRC